MNSENKVWAIVVALIAFVMITIGLEVSIYYRNETTKGFAAGLCQIQNVGTSGYRWDTCSKK
jgi:hypothetical protein